MRKMRVSRYTPFPALIALAASALAGVTTASPAAAAATVAIAPPIATGQLRDGGVVAATGLSWRPGDLPHNDRLLSFEVSYGWQACPVGGTHGCRAGADTTVTPFAASRYIVGHADTGLRIR